MSPSGPRLLLLARSFPPVANIATLRMCGIACHMQRLGWQVDVACPDPALLRSRPGEERLRELLAEGVKTVHTGYARRWLLPGMFRQGALGGTPLGGAGRRLARMLDLDDGSGWIGPLQKAFADKGPGSYDVVLASGSPYGAFVAAGKLARRFGCPFVLDYRDPWTLRDFRDVPVRPWTRALEQRLCDRAAAVIHVSPMLIPPHVEAFGGREKQHTLTNGYEPEVLDRVPAADFDHPAIVYAGRFYPPHRVIDPVLAAIGRLKQSDPEAWRNLRFHYYGADGATVARAAGEQGLQDCLVDHGRVPQEEAWSALRGAAAAVTVTSVAGSVSQGVLGNLPGKLFEMIGLGCATLLVSPEGSQARRILAETRGGESAAGDDPQALDDALRKLLQGKRDTGPRNTNYAWPTLARRLDGILRPLVGKGSQ